MEDFMLTKNFVLPSQKLPTTPVVSQDAAASGQRSTWFEKMKSQDDLSRKSVTILEERIKNEDKSAVFHLGQFYFNEGNFNDAKRYFEKVVRHDFKAMYQLSIILYDGLGCATDCQRGVELMVKIAESRSQRAKHLVHAAEYNIGRAYLEGYGVARQSDAEAERWWLRAAADGSRSGSNLAQTTLGYYYTRRETRDLPRAFFWHSEACGNGSIESQGALGVMYLFGLGVKKNRQSAYECLTEASERGNVYAMGHLAKHYFDIKLFNKAADLAARVALLEDVQNLAKETDCLPGYVSKGISLSAFVFARCLHRGLGVKKDERQARFYYNRSFNFDPDVCAKMQSITNLGQL